MADLEPEEERGSSEEGEGKGEEKQNGVPLGPRDRDKIKVAVQKCEKAGDDHIYNIEVGL